MNRPEQWPADHYAGLKITILGIARQGTALARFLLSRGAQVTLSDTRSAAALAPICAELERYASEHGQGALRWALGGHPDSLLDDASLLCLSGGVSPALPIVQEAMRRGIKVTNDAVLSLRHCPAPVIGITGSAGKTTTTTLTGLMLEASGLAVHVGGNIGAPLIDRLDRIGSGDKVVMELSSFQLELFDASPAVAAVLGITPNHLDRHPSMSHYAAAKANILRHQGRGDTCILNADDRYTGPWLHTGRCEIEEGEGQAAVYFPIQAMRLGFSLTGEVPDGAFMAGDVLIWRRPGLPDVEICRVGEVHLRGRHNLANILAACCIAAAAGANIDGIRRAATGFDGVEHRLEIVRRRNGVLWVNDSIATAPERTIAALHSFEEPLILLLGGRDKNLPWDECAAAVHACGRDGRPRVRRVILFGEAAALIDDALTRHASRANACKVTVTHSTGLAEAVAAASQIAVEGDVVLLAPGATSFDAYEDFAARGRHFRELVEALP